ncbi:MAG: DnaJ domain-containing protein [Rhizobiales bacterium]|nr:DnaJ domain-containing protein [Hyphomicrobiales bacterium]
MKADSKYFDRIRVKPRDVEPEGPRCQWNGCLRTATHRAPKGRSHEGQYLHFCVDHVREYNRGYNYFDGMRDDDVARYQRDNVTGHRPTWKLGVRGGAAPAGGAKTAAAHETIDPFGLFGAAPKPPPRAPKRTIGNAARKAFDTLGLDAGASSSEIKAKYKVLVKRHHPDANGGTRDAEDRLVEIIKAYRYLRGAGFC